jgi:hypothetical protein
VTNGQGYPHVYPQISPQSKSPASQARCGHYQDVAARLIAVVLDHDDPVFPIE